MIIIRTGLNIRASGVFTFYIQILKFQSVHHFLKSICSDFGVVFHQQATKTVKEKSTWEEQIEPYRSDNAKLTRENNDLHQQLIKVKEDSEATIKDLKASIRKLEHENADLRFLNSQYVHKVRAIEKDAKAKSDRINELQQKNFHAVVQTPGK